MSGRSVMRERIKRFVKARPLLAIPYTVFARVLRGYIAYARILRRFPGEGRHIYLMDYDGSGDTYVLCSLLCSCGRIQEDDVFIGAGQLTARIAKLLGFEKSESVSLDDALSIRVMERFLGRELRLLPLLYESWPLEYSGIMRAVQGLHGLNFMQMLRIGLESRIGLSYSEETFVQPGFPCERAEIDAIFERFGFIPGQTVLIAPYAGKGELFEFTLEFFAELAQRLKRAGFTVCCNAAPGELPVPGTVPLFLKHRMMRGFCARAGVFIGQRSGLCDIVSAAKGCKLIVLYNREPLIPGLASNRTFFSLKNMGLRENTVELEIDESGNLSELVNEIMKAVNR